MIQTSETLGQLFAALAKAQAQIQNAERTAKNAHTRSEYTTLAAALDAVRPALASNGLCVMQWPAMDGELVTVTTRIGHGESGEWMESTASARPDQQRNPVQAVGSTITYLRRYALMGVAGIAPEDDDGNAAGQRRQQQRRPAPVGSKAAHDKTWEAGRASFCRRLGELGVKYEQVADYLEAHGRVRPSQMATPERAKVLSWLADGGAAQVQGVAR